MMWLTLGHTVPAQCLAGEVPEGHGAIAGPGQQEGGVRRQCAHSERTAARVLQHRGHLTCPRDPHDHRAVRGAAEQVAAARAEAAAVDPVPVTRQRGEGELREVRGVVNTEGLVPGGGGQQGRREGAAAHLVRVLLQGDGQWHHLVGTECSTLPGERFSHKVAQNAQISACDGKQGDGWRSDEPRTDSCASWRSHVELIKRRKNKLQICQLRVFLLRCQEHLVLPLSWKVCFISRSCYQSCDAQLHNVYGRVFHYLHQKNWLPSGKWPHCSLPLK